MQADNKLYHYVYETKIITPERFMLYYGKHSTDNLKDGYQGSGLVVVNALKKIERLKRENKTVNIFVYTNILKFFDTQKEAFDYEEKIIQAEYDSEFNVNIAKGGLGLAKGSKISEETKQKIRVARREYLNSDAYTKRMNSEENVKRRLESARKKDIADKLKKEIRAQSKSITSNKEFMKWHKTQLKWFYDNDKSSMSPVLVDKYEQLLNASALLSKRATRNNVNSLFKTNNPVKGVLPWMTPRSLSMIESQITWSNANEIYDVWIETQFKYKSLRTECLKRGIDAQINLNKMVAWFENNNPHDYDLPKKGA